MPPEGGALQTELAETRAPRLVAVAVPVPLFQPLVYSVPEGVAPVVGGRVRVPLGRRSLVGVVVETDVEPPRKGTVRDLLRVVDEEPALTPGLLALGHFVADYYIEPVGEVMRTLLPGKLKPRGGGPLQLTERGAMARPDLPWAREVIETLLLDGPQPAGALALRLGAPAEELTGTLLELQVRGVLMSPAARRQGPRYKAGVELVPRPAEDQLALCGRSAKAKAVVQYLREVGRPALVEEVTAAVECGAAVVRRLVKLGVLRSFTEIQALDLGRHRLSEPDRREAAVRLRPDQDHAVTALCHAVDQGHFAPFLLSGMTGSGKTEVYLRAIERTLERERAALILVPEIALVPALARDLTRRFGERVAILHSNLGQGERQQEWERIERGEARVVLGPRSALFAPTDAVGLIVVDEEQDSSFKQDSTPRYHGRDLAMVRARACDAVAVVASATPSLETRYNVERGRYRELQLTERAGHGRLPDGHVVDLRHLPRQRPGEIHFSEELVTAVGETLERGEQVILLRNRRGYAPLLLCRACGEDFRCDDCGLPRTLHRRDRTLICHYCGSSVAEPTACGSCGEEALEPVGAGTERVEEELRRRFPQARLGVLDRDVARRPGGAAAVLERFARGETQMLVGTQMISKGHHFPRVSLTGVLSADTYLGFPDFRAVEKTYALLTQLAGRAGRGDIPGRVLIQTHHPDHYAVRAALAGDDAGFAAEEMRFRRAFFYPPFSRMVLLLCRDADRERAVSHMRDVAEAVRNHPRAAEVLVSGPAPAPLERLRGQWRFQLVLRARSGKTLRELVREVATGSTAKDLVIDVDPHDLM